MNTINRLLAPPRRCAGLTLIEVMVAIVIALILLAVTISVFVGNKRSYTEQEEMSRLQENARYALETMTRAIRMANYGGGCVNDKSLINVHANDGLAVNPTVIEGFEMDGVQWFPSGNAAPPAATGAGDGIRVRYISPGAPMKLNTDMAGDPGADVTVEVTSPTQLPLLGDNITITDCFHTDVFKVTNSVAAPASYNPFGLITLKHSSSGNVAVSGGSASCNSGAGASAGQLCTAYAPPVTYVFKGGGYKQYEYYIGDEDCNKVTADTGARNLCRADNGGVAQPLVEDIEHMEILYGEDTSGDRVPDRYVTAANVGTWSNVVSVQLALLARTPAPSALNTDTKTYQLLNQVYGPFNDGYRRRMFSTTIQLRNLVTQP